MGTCCGACRQSTAMYRCAGLTQQGERLAFLVLKRSHWKTFQGRSEQYQTLLKALGLELDHYVQSDAVSNVN